MLFVLLAGLWWRLDLPSGSVWLSCSAAQPDPPGFLENLLSFALQIRIATGPAIIKPKEDKERRGWLASRRLIMFSTNRMEIKLRMEILKYVFIKFSFIYI